MPYGRGPFDDGFGAIGSAGRRLMWWYIQRVEEVETFIY